MNELAALLQQHIYLALLVGSVVEGETVVVLAGLAAHEGYVSWWRVTLVATVLNTAVDQLCFALGYFRGAALLRRFPGLRRRVHKLRPRLYRHRRWLILVLRFTYGLRIAGPVALGMVRVPPLEFAFYNLLAAAVWSATFSSLGYFLGLTLLHLLQAATDYEHYAVLALLAVGALAWLYSHWRRR